MNRKLLLLPCFLLILILATGCSTVQTPTNLGNQEIEKTNYGQIDQSDNGKDKTVSQENNNGDMNKDEEKKPIEYEERISARRICGN